MPKKSETEKSSGKGGKSKAKGSGATRKVRDTAEVVADQVKLVKALQEAPDQKLGTAKLSLLLKGKRTPSQITSTVKGLKEQGVVTAEGKLRGTVYTLVPAKAKQFIEDAGKAA